MKSVLLHVCCAHCAAYTVEHWRGEGYAVIAFWYNPNIHPYTEHQQRLESTQRLAATMDLPLLTTEGYEMPEYFRRVAGNEEQRCRHCFDMRLSRTAATAREKGLDAFTSTLLISPHQQHENLRKTGETVAAKEGVEFLYADLRKRYSDSRHITKPMELYRQQYCGCLYSELDRYTDN
jgi:predicted adenine nucleotide alpha hydrolase (AANH) superfamily ATPase